MKWRLRDGVQKEEGLNCTGTCFGFAENIFCFFWRCILKGFFEQEIRCNYICNKGGMMCGNNMLLIDLALHIPIIFPDVFLFQ